MIRVVLPAHLRSLARFEGELHFDLAQPVSIASVIDAIEQRYPMLRGTIRDQSTKKRRPYIRFFACERDLSHDPAHATLPAAITSGNEPLLIVGAMSGG